VTLLHTNSEKYDIIVSEKKRRKLMKPRITLNEDKDIVATVKQGLKERGGYCPCRFEKTEENKCICQEFKDQIADPDFEGFCHCMLYYKHKG
jgi:ferredoxin-thioredoxin reductase catalytic subunit